ncbi:MAG: hypothetical protein QXI64_02345 [Sulfolobales archaeon]
MLDRLQAARLVAFVSLAELLILSFVGGLVSGLGQGFDLGIEWPSEPVKLIRILLQGSLEPLHRILTVLSAPFLIILAIIASRIRRSYPYIFFSALLSVLFLTLTAITGRMILLALGGYIEQPMASLIYSLNNLLAMLTIGSVAMVVGILDHGLRVKISEERRIAVILHRGASAWGLIAAFLGAYMLGYTKTTQKPLPSDLFSLSTGSVIDIVVKVHVLSGLAAVLLTLAAYALRRSRDAWSTAALIASLFQPLLGLALLYRASHYAWAPGIYLPLHLIAAQVIIIGNAIPYLLYLYNRVIPSNLSRRTT